MGCDERLVLLGWWLVNAAHNLASSLKLMSWPTIMILRKMMTRVVRAVMMAMIMLPLIQNILIAMTMGKATGKMMKTTIRTMKIRKALCILADHPHVKRNSQLSESDR